MRSDSARRASRLPADRFEKRQAIISDPDFTRVRTRTFRFTAEEGTAESRATVTVDDYHKGLLSFLGAGPSETKRVASTITTKSGSSLLTGRKVVTRVRIEGPPPGSERINVYFDRVYGTFALQVP